MLRRTSLKVVVTYFENVNRYLNVYNFYGEKDGVISKIFPILNKNGLVEDIIIGDIPIISYCGIKGILDFNYLYEINGVNPNYGNKGEKTIL